MLFLVSKSCGCQNINLKWRPFEGLRRLKRVSGFSNFTMYVVLRSFVDDNLTIYSFSMMHYHTMAMLTPGNNVQLNIGQKCVDPELFEISEGL